MSIGRLLLQGTASHLPLRDESVQCVVTSPPYWGLRQYAGEQREVWGGDHGHDHGHDHGRKRSSADSASGIAGTPRPGNEFDASLGASCACGAWYGALGLEPTPELYVDHMVAVFREVRRVLCKDGTLWLNLGDSYAGSGKGGNPDPGKQATNRGSQSIGVLYGKVGQSQRDAEMANVSRRAKEIGLKPKDLVGIPWRLAFALQGFAVISAATLVQWADWLREAREHRDWELVEMVETRLRLAALTDALKADGWYLRSDIIWAKPNSMPESVTDRPTKAHEYLFLLSKSARYYYDADAIREPHSEASLERYTYAPSSYAVEHADVHLGGRRPANGVDHNPAGRNKRTVWTIATQPYAGAHYATFPEALVEPCILAGSRPGDTILDPFAGSGTVGRVALRHGRSYVGIDISREYMVEQATKRTTNVQMEALL